MLTEQGNFAVLYYYFIRQSEIVASLQLHQVRHAMSLTLSQEVLLAEIISNVFAYCFIFETVQDWLVYKAISFLARVCIEQSKRK